MRRLRLRVLLVEAVDATGGIHQLLLAREERVAVRADVDAEVTARRERVVDHSARTRDAGGAIVRVSSGVLHSGAVDVRLIGPERKPVLRLN